MKSKVEYHENALVLYLPCSDPAALHASLMQSIAANMSAISCVKRKIPEDDVAPLIELLRVILPGELALSKAYQES